MSTLRSIVVSAALLTLPAAAQDHRFEADPVVTVRENFVACDVLSQLQRVMDNPRFCLPVNASRWAQDVGSVSTQAAGHMFVSIQKIRSRRANGHTRKYCRNSLSNAPAVTREAEEDWARQQWRRTNSSIVPPLNVKTARS
jgi:hypothetical protein